MGLHVSHSRAARHPSIRIFSCNIHLGTFGRDKVIARVRAAGADIVLLQEAEKSLDFFRLALPDYSVEDSGGFVLATRLPVTDPYEPGKILANGVLRSPRFVGYTLDTPIGALRLLDVHPISSREGFTAVRGKGLRREILSGRIFHQEWATMVMANATLPGLQIAAIAEEAARSPLPTLVAGDTNLPKQSFFLTHYFGGFVDGFADVGSGFGYTFPTDKRAGPWMRIDRMLASRELEFLRLSVDPEPASDHFCINADLARL
jgi:hypothetical protein